MMLMQGVLAVILVMDFVDAQILEQPSAGIRFVPVNDQTNFSCTAEENYSIDWEVTLRNVTIRAARESDSATFSNFGFAFVGIATSRSTLSFGIFDESGSRTNNATRITCLARQGAGTPLRGNEVQVIFYDAPPPPTDLSVTEYELGSLNISWSLGFIEGVPVNYTLTALNLNTTSAQIFDEIQDNFYNFNTSRPCDVYNFTVTAISVAGNSTPSQELIFKRNDSEMCQVIHGMHQTTKSDDTTDSETTHMIPSNRSDNIGGAVGGVVAVGIVVAVGLAIFLLIYFVHRHKKKKLKIDETEKDLATNSDPELSLVTRTDVTSPMETEIQSLHSIKDEPEGKVLDNRSSFGSLDTSEDDEKKDYTELDRKSSLGGLCACQDSVYLLEKNKGGITVFRNRKEHRFICLERNDLAEITVDSNTGNIFVTTGKATGQVLKLDSNGKLLKHIDFKDLKGNRSRKEFHPNGLCINTKNELFVCDSRNYKIYVFDINLNLIRTIPNKKGDCRPFKTPRDVEFDKDGNIYIAEFELIQVLSNKERFLQTIKEKKLHDPICMKIFNNSIYVTSHGGACILIYSINNKKFKDLHRFKRGYDRPLGITVDNEGYVYVSTVRGKLLIFNPQNEVEFV